mmetsp:Transcript_13867/g.34878  ORF Transcript_13867/g.34878 Transcript_13867/m.34878 type:complete len:240 (-) Transcript_13867:7-726(-)
MAAGPRSPRVSAHVLPSTTAVTWAPAPAPAPAAAIAWTAIPTLPLPLREETSAKTAAHAFDVHEIALPAAAAPPAPLVVAANCLVKIRHRRKLPLNRPAKVITPVQRRERCLCRPGAPEARVHISIQVLSRVLANVQLQHFPVLGKLFEDVLHEVLVVVLKLRVGRRPLMRIHGETHVHIAEEHRLALGRLPVNPRALVAVPARPYLRVEGTVHAVPLGPRQPVPRVRRHPFAGFAGFL